MMNVQDYKRYIALSIEKSTKNKIGSTYPIDQEMNKFYIDSFLKDFPPEDKENNLEYEKKLLNIFFTTGIFANHEFIHLLKINMRFNFLAQFKTIFKINGDEND